MFAYHESIVTPSFREAVVSRHAPTSRRKPCLRLLDYLLFGSAIDKDERLLMLPHELCVQFRNSTGKTNNFVASKLFERFNKEFFRLEYRNHSAIAGKVRLVTEVALPDWLVEARDRMYAEPGGNRTVRLVSGLPADLDAETAHVRSEALLDVPAAKSAMAQDVLDYLNGLDPALFNHLPGRIPDALAKMDVLESGSRIVQSGLLNGVHRDPKPLYKPVPNSARLYTAGPGFLNMKSCVRDVFTDGWLKIDLRQAQFAVVSKLWDVEGLRSYVESVDGSVWADLMRRANVPYSSDAKDAVKRAVYSMIYGAQEHNARRRLAKEITEAAADRFMALPVMRLVLEKREERYKRLYDELDATDAYGNRLELGPYDNKWQRRSDAMSILARQAQSYELPILYPLIQYSRETAGTNDPFVVTAWLHDGVWAKCAPESAERHLAHIENLVRASSTNLLGFEMQLEIG